MADLLQILPSLQVSSDDILDSELFAQQYLQAIYPDLDLREGTGLRDTVIRPVATMIALVRKGINYYMDANAISKITDTTPQDMVDTLMSNWFLTRRVGTKAVLSIRLYFSISKNITIPTSVYFSPDNVLMYSPVTNYILTENNLTYYAFSKEWYVDIDVTSEISNESYNISSGDLLYFTNFDPYFLRGEINYLKQAAISPETNLQFVTRAKTAISTRNLINKPSIASKLQEVFPMLRSCVPIGFGDPEMVRDQIYVQLPYSNNTTTLFHNGGKVDVYCRTGLTVTKSQVTLDGTGKVTITGPIYKIEQDSSPSDDIDDNAEYTVSYRGFSEGPGKLDSPELDVTFSDRQIMDIQFPSSQAEKKVTFKLYHFVNLDGIQNYITDEMNRVVCADLLARGPNIYLIDFLISSYVSDAIDDEVVEDIVTRYLDSLEPGEPLLVSDLVSWLHGEGVVSIKIPLDITYICYNRDMTVTTGEVVDKLDPQDRTAIYLVNSVTVESAPRAGGVTV